MAVVPFFIKTPTESFVIGLDFTDDMPDGATLSSGVCSAVVRKTEASATATILSGGTTPTIVTADNVAQISIAGGAVGTWYEVLFTMTCSNSAVIQGKALLFVDL